MRTPRVALISLCSLIVLALAACASRAPRELKRTGDEIVIAGRYFHTGAPVILWTDPNGYDAYRVERRFVPIDKASWEETATTKDGPKTPNRYGARAGLSFDEAERVRGGGWTLDLLQRHVDQFVLHFDVCGTSKRCFDVLHDHRGLSVHFMLDIDGTIYQTLDVKERAWHATTSNDRSVGVEIANIGAYPPGNRTALDRWYSTEWIDQPLGFTPAPHARSPALIPPPSPLARTTIHIPLELGDGGVRLPGPFAPARGASVTRPIQGTPYVMYDFTPQQYDSLRKLTRALCAVLPRIRRDYPRDAEGRLITRKLDDESLKNFSGVLGHYHIQANKIDPGPAMQWDYVVGRTDRLER